MNGPNLNLLGLRQPEVYGTMTLADVEQICLDQAREIGVEVDFVQSNHEGVLIDAIHDARGTFRHRSYISKVAVGQICGFGALGYVLGLQAICNHLEAQNV